MSTEKKTVERLNFLIDPEVRQQIKRWRFQNEIETEGEAVRQLILAGLEAKRTQVAA